MLANMTPRALYYAHSENAAHQWHALSDHLRHVAEMARDFATPLGVAQEAYLAGLLHDLGKYGDRFQRRLEGKERGLDHWAAGSVLALTAGHALAASAVIAGHHCGLPTLTPDVMRRLRDMVEHGEPHPGGLRLTTDTNTDLRDRFTGDGFVIPSMNEGCCLPGWPTTVAAMLDTRMLYSTLVDADYLDTEAHFLTADVGTRYARTAGPPLQADRALEILIAHVETLRAGQCCTPEVQQVRDQLFADCLHAGKEPIGVRTLTAPTGAGKTLAMLAFALQQAAIHGLRRIVMVIPYLSIIEQTAAVYRALFAPHFGPDYVLEHHSLATTGKGAENEDDDEKQARLLTQNWDAPLIVTTSVQMLESLFAARPAACRKLHRLAESVLLFDEVQSLPETLAVPTLAALAHLAPRYRSTVVFSTATQPAFEHLDAAVRQLNSPGWQPREIVTDTASMFDKTRRVQVHWPSPDETTTFPALAAELAACAQVLCVVNLKRHARALVDALTGVTAVYHLSTGMCPAHRKACLEEVRQRLLAGEPCRLISTQCIEAGVDVDFPCVYRAFAPLEAVAQAAGRCNRNGHRGISAVRVFRPDDAGKSAYPSRDYERAAHITDLILGKYGAAGMDLCDPSLYNAYYRRRYDLTQPEEQSPELREAFGCADFPTVAAKYRLINQDTINVLTPYDLAQYRALYDEVFAHGLRADWMRRAQPFAVAIQRPRGQRDFPLEPCPIDVRHTRGEVSSEWFIAPEHGGYDALLGFAPDHPLVLCC
jgi:CRISPR-associated helicase Cas3/CRISPR-associated endonuclease Cas3-HD